jgi:hypothetical protein
MRSILVDYKRSFQPKAIKRDRYKSCQRERKDKVVVIIKARQKQWISSKSRATCLTSRCLLCRIIAVDEPFFFELHI